jgi:two-component system, NtrC family, response regulator AtoC
MKQDKIPETAPPADLDVATLWATVEAAFPDAGIFVVDGDQTVRAFSRGAERLLGYRAAEVVGEHCRKSNRCQTCMIGCGLRDRRSVDDVPLVIHREDGTSVAVRKTARAFPSPDGRFIGGVEILIPDTHADGADAATADDRKPAPTSSRLPILDDVVDTPIQRSGILTRDPAMRRLLQMVENVSLSDVSVLLRGESGTGKELFARLVHESSHRASGPFLAVNCAAVAPTLLESELFGHEKGAFTGAIATHHGYFERADGGTLFLDEVAELPLDVQAKLLRVLETRTFFRVGGKKPITVDVRVVSATHRSLRQEVAAGRFREDLLYRLRVVPIFLPPLRERKGDIPLLVEHFLERLNAQSKQRRSRVVERVAPDALRALLEWPFPGNVRELKNTVEYAFAVGSGPVLQKSDLPQEILLGTPARLMPLAPALDLELPAPSPSAPTTMTAPPTPTPKRGRPPRPLDERERERIAEALRQSHGDVGAAAAMLGMSRATFWRRRQAWGL